MTTPVRQPVPAFIGPFDPDDPGQMLEILQQLYASVSELQEIVTDQQERIEELENP